MASIDGKFAPAAQVTISPTHGPLRDRLLGGTICFHSWETGEQPARQGTRGRWSAHLGSVSMGCYAEGMSIFRLCGAQRQLLDSAPTVRRLDWGLARGRCQIRRLS